MSKADERKAEWREAEAKKSADKTGSCKGGDPGASEGSSPWRTREQRWSRGRVGNAAGECAWSQWMRKLIEKEKSKVSGWWVALKKCGTSGDGNDAVTLMENEPIEAVTLLQDELTHGAKCADGCGHIDVGRVDRRVETGAEQVDGRIKN